jgi:hypothetical protein
MAGGRRLESIALGEYEALMGFRCPSVCAVHDQFDWVKCSYDGYNAQYRGAGWTT